MEDAFAIGIFALILAGYLGLSAAVGVYASRSNRSFLLYFLLALFISPFPIFFLVFFLNIVTGPTASANSDQLQNVAEERTDRSKDEGPPRDPDIVESSPGAETMSEEPVTETSVEENRDTIHWEGEEKVRCENCYSRIDETASECPACGTDLGGSGWFS